jgi:tRNA nucleotidyltransferase/poly(A) polymerase
MHASHLLKSAKAHVAPEQRLASYAQSETRLTWTALFFDAFPRAEIYLVGGSVRDVLLGRPANDLDLVIKGVPHEELQAWLLGHGAAEFVGRFGTFKFIPHGMGGTEPIDIALPRKEFISENHSSSSRDIKVTFDPMLSIKEDLARRDFTVNAMAFNLRNGHLIDPFLGLKDLEDGIVNAVLVPHHRFHEDASRIIRGLRFASQLGFAIEAGTWQAMCANIHLLNQTTAHPDDGHFIYSVPREIIGREFLLGFGAHPEHTLKLWRDSGALHLFMPQLADLEGQEHQGAYARTQKLIHALFSPVLMNQYGVHEPPLNAQVAALLLYPSLEDPAHAHSICMKLHFHQFGKNHRSYVDCDEVLWLVKHARILQTTDPAAMRPSAFEHTFLSPRGKTLTILIHALLLAEDRHSVERERLHVLRRLESDFQNRLAPPLISGSDLAALDIPPGPQYRELLAHARDAQLSGKIATKPEAIQLVIKLRSS